MKYLNYQTVWPFCLRWTSWPWSRKLLVTRSCTIFWVFRKMTGMKKCHMTSFHLRKSFWNRLRNSGFVILSPIMVNGSVEHVFFLVFVWKNNPIGHNTIFHWTLIMAGRVAVRESHFLRVKVETREIKIAEERLATLECGLYKVYLGTICRKIWKKTIDDLTVFDMIMMTLPECLIYSILIYA